MMEWQKFLSKARVLIVDGCLASRLAMQESLLEMGVDSQQIVMTKNLADARLALELEPVQLILSDYLLEDGIGFSLMNPANPEVIFLLVSGDSSQAAIAKAAEEEVDDFLFKPYAFEDFKTVLIGAIERKFDSEGGQTWVEEGKRLTSVGAFRAAIMQFERAKEEQATFASACAYLAQIRRFQDQLTQAHEEYQYGLEQNEVHFRCLNGLYEVLLHQKSMTEAYYALKNLVLSFPEHPERLSVAMSLAIHTRNFHDVDIFYEVFQRIYEKTPSLINHVSSALSVAGRYHLMKKRPEAAIERFENAIQVSDGQPKFLAYIANHLTQAGYDREAEALLDRHSRRRAG